jgi:hypothetical protein
MPVRCSCTCDLICWVCCAAWSVGSSSAGAGAALKHPKLGMLNGHAFWSVALSVRIFSPESAYVHTECTQCDGWKLAWLQYAFGSCSLQRGSGKPKTDSFTIWKHMMSTGWLLKGDRGLQFSWDQSPTRNFTEAMNGCAWRFWFDRVADCLTQGDTPGTRQGLPCGTERPSCYVLTTVKLI